MLKSKRTTWSGRLIASTALVLACNGLLSNDPRTLDGFGGASGGDASGGAGGEGGAATAGEHGGGEQSGGVAGNTGGAGAAGGAGVAGEGGAGGAAGSRNEGGKAGAASGGSAGAGAEGGCGECIPNEVGKDEAACGPCKIGKQTRTRTCTSACIWGSWSDFSACVTTAECEPNTPDSKSDRCPGACGPRTFTRTCSSACKWGEWTQSSSSCVACSDCGQVKYCDAPDSNIGTWCLQTSNACNDAEIEADCMAILADKGCLRHEPFYIEHI